MSPVAGHNFQPKVLREVDADVVIIGSGAGGAVAAKELSEMGYKVVVVEEGAYYKKEDFNLKPVEAFRKLYRLGGHNLTIGKPIIMLPIGCSVGGSTTIFSGTMLRAPSRILKRWKLEHGLTELNEEELALIYKTIEEFMFVQRADPEVAGVNARLFLETAEEKLGLSGGWLPRCAKDCEGFGSCAIGCPSGSKQSMDVSYMPAALEAGAELFTRCRAERIIIENGKACGVEASILHESHSEGNSENIQGKMIVRAKVVVLAAGTVYTPLFLLKQGICNSSGLVGKNLSIHPCVAIVAELEKEIGNPKGIPQASYIDEFEADGVMLEGSTVAPGLHAMSMPFSGKKHREHMNNFSRTGMFGAMISETESEGSVSTSPLGKYRPLIRYNLKGVDIKKAKLGVIAMAQVWFAAGARKIITPVLGFQELSSPKDLLRLEKAKLKASDLTYMGAFHPMGTCRMGSEADYSVVKHTGETWDVEDLYILDGSILPTSLGVNPMLTISALSMRASGYIDDRLAGIG